MPKRISADWRVEMNHPPHDVLLTRYSATGEAELEMAFEWKRIGNRSEVVAVTICTPGFARPLSVSDIRGIPFSLLEALERQARADLVVKEMVIEANHGPQSGRPLNSRDLQAVAALYRYAHEHGLPTARYIANQLDISESTVGKRIAAARRAGLLGPSIGTKAGERARLSTKGQTK
jgi:hypothetical protein